LVSLAYASGFWCFQIDLRSNRQPHESLRRAAKGYIFELRRSGAMLPRERFAAATQFKEWVERR